MAWLPIYGCSTHWVPRLDPKLHSICWSAVAPIAWAATTQLGQILPWRDCAAGFELDARLVRRAIALSAFGSIFGLGVGKNWELLAKEVASQLLAAMFMFAISLQGAAIMLVDPCAR